MAVIMRDQEIRQRIRMIVEREAGKHLAGVLLFGSRARGDHVPDSDWDIAIMVDSDSDARNLHDRIFRALSADPVLWDEIIQPIVLRPPGYTAIPVARAQPGR